MRFVIQRSTGAKVTVDGQITGQIGTGLVILVGITHDDEQADIDYLVNKTVNLRIFKAVEGASGFDLSLLDVNGAVLLISQFTLFADTRKGRRPGLYSISSRTCGRAYLR